MVNKMTHKDYFNEIVALAEENGRSDIADFARGRLEVLAHKAENRKPTKAQVENEAFKAEVLSVLTAEGATISEVMGRSSALSALSNQKVSAVVNSLVKAGKVVKVREGKKSLFSLA